VFSVSKYIEIVNLTSKVLISSSKVTDRTAGLKELINILKHNRGKATLENFGNKAYSALCDTLFQCMRDERSSYLRSKSRTAKTAAVLPLCASALRHIINSGVRSIKISTVEVIIDSIIEILPGNKEKLITPLLEDVPKTLRALLEYQPHVERLSQDCWDAIVDFCIQSLSSFFLEPDVDEVQNSWSTTVSSRGRSRTPLGSTDLTAKSSARDLPVKKTISEEFVHAAEDFVHCLGLLTKASNAPILEKADPILTVLVQYLQRRTGRSNSVALAAINSTLSRITLHSTQLAKRTIQDLLPLMRSMWSEALLRDELLITLMHTETHLSSMLSDAQADASSHDLEQLVETMYADYRRRQESGVLQFLEDDHLCFRYIGKARTDAHPLHTYAFSLEAEHIRSESLWATVSTIARFSAMLDARKRSLIGDRDEDEDAPPKRLRITHSLREYLRDVSEPRSNAKRAALQVLAFMVQEEPLNVEDLQSILEKLITHISDENPVHSSWAMLVLAA
jgi:ataxia telangiectasia mutated family protein